MNQNMLQGRRVLIAEPIAGCSERSFHLFAELGCELVVGPDVSRTREGYSRQQLIEFGGAFDGIIGMSREKFPRDILEAFTRVRVICKYGIGVDHIDLAAACERGILVSNTLVHHNTVAEHAFAVILALLKKLSYCQRHLKNFGWRDETTLCSELYHKKIGVVGLGGIGRQFIQRLQGWEVELIGCDPYVDAEQAAAMGVTKVDWQTLFRQSDVISVHMPLTEETRGAIGAAEFAMMKPEAVIVNTSRGGIIDQSALVAALKSGRIAGAGLDVFEKEPLAPGMEILALSDHVVLTPHNAGWTREALLRIATQAHVNCIEALKGNVPVSVANPQVLQGWVARFGQGAVS
jgi:D-3-phosphoglycerate dehydrogenase